jgi:hypothetical protein
MEWCERHASGDLARAAGIRGRAGPQAGGPKSLLLFALMVVAMNARAAEPIVIIGPEQASLDLKLPGGGLPAAAGVANIQVFRASRACPELTDGRGWTYHHHVDMGCWKGRLYVGWNSCEKDEDVWPSRELYSTSSDGLNWSKPAELFPQGVSTALRMYFFDAPNGRMLAIAGMRASNDRHEPLKGALVVRAIRADHSLGAVYALRPPDDRKQPAAAPAFDESADAGFVDACRQLLANKPYLEQSDYGTLLGSGKMKWHDLANWPATEPSRADFARFGKAMDFYHRRDGKRVAVMKWGWVLVSDDQGRTWSPPVRPKSLVAGMAKVWGQRTSDGRYALLYNPDLTERFPLIAVSGDDGITFANMRVVQGEVPPIRYPGLYKVPGPQYVRGISEWSGDGSRTDAALWVAYSMSKEDIWVSRIPVPIVGADSAPAARAGNSTWNLYSPQWARASVENDADGSAVVRLEDRDPCDFAMASRWFAPSPTADFIFDLMVDDSAGEPLHIDIQGPRAVRAARLSVGADGAITIAEPPATQPGRIKTGKSATLRIRADAAARTVDVWLNGRTIATSAALAQSCGAVCGISFTTGDRKPLASPERDRPTAPAQFRITHFRASVK